MASVSSTAQRIVEAPFEDAVAARCRRISERIAQGAARGKDDVVAALNEVIAAELACVQRYGAELAIARALHGDEAVAGFAEHVAEEQSHADRLAAHVHAIGGLVTPCASGDGCKVNAAASLEELVLEDIRAERAIIGTYQALADWLRPADARAAQLMDRIALEEREHLYR